MEIGGKEVKGPKDNVDGFYQCVGGMQILKKTNIWPLGKSVVHRTPPVIPFGGFLFLTISTVSGRCLHLILGGSLGRRGGSDCARRSDCVLV